MTSSDFKFFAFGDEGLDHPLSGFPFEPEFAAGISDHFLESSKILGDGIPPMDEAMSPMSLLDNPVSDSFGMQETQFPPFNLAGAFPQTQFPAFDSSFDLAPAPSSPMVSRLSFDAYPESPFPFTGVSSESSVDQSDCESLAAVHEASMESGLPAAADRSYFKVDLEFPWQVYIRDPERLEKVTAWKKKKVQVLQEHKVKKNTYQVRTDVANRRMRVKGRFVGKCIPQ